jgi:hypothetical protein
MIRHGKPALYALLFVVCFVTHSAIGQAAVPAGAPAESVAPAAAPAAAAGAPAAMAPAAAPADIGTVLAAFRDAAPYERSDKRAEVVKLGDAAVDPLIAEVAKLPSSTDPSYIGQCVIALGELKAPRATSVLLTVLESERMQLVYWACSALGDIWEGKAGTSDQGKLANAMVLARLYSPRPSLALLGPALALVQMNGIPITRPEGMAPEQLKDEVGKWFEQNPGALPAPQQQPWQVLLHAALAGTDAAARQTALQILQQKGDLGAVEPILSVLAKAAQPPDAASNDLGKLLAAMTGVAFPPEGAAPTATSSDLVTGWKGNWFRKLIAQTDPKYVLYAWRELETSLHLYEESPSEETVIPVRYYRSVLVYELRGPDAIPAAGSPQAKELMTKPLEVKKRIGDALTKAETQESAIERSIQLNIISDEMSKRAGKDEKIGREVTLQFLTRLDKLARKEPNQKTAKLLGTILGQASGIPCDLDRDSIERRGDRLKEWENEARRVGLPLDLVP